MSKKLLFLSAIVGILLSGCMTTTLQTNAKMTNSIFVDPVAKNQRTIFIAMKNTSGQNINLENGIIQGLQAKGYKIIDDPEKANFILMTNVLYLDQKRESNAPSAATTMGMAGAGVGAYNTGSAGSTIAIGLGSAVIGGLLGKITEDTIYQMQVDVVIRQKSDQLVSTYTGNVSGQANVRDRKSADFADAYSGPIRNIDKRGHLDSNSVNTKDQAYNTKYVEQKTMVFAEATKRNLQLEEAKPVLEEKITSQIVGLF